MFIWILKQPQRLLAGRPLSTPRLAAASQKRNLPSLTAPQAATSVQSASPVTEPAAPKNKRIDQQIVQEFRSKLKLAEDLVSKLAFSLREIQGVWNKPEEPKEHPLPESLMEESAPLASQAHAQKTIVPWRRK